MNEFKEKYTNIFKLNNAIHFLWIYYIKIWIYILNKYINNTLFIYFEFCYLYINIHTYTYV